MKARQLIHENGKGWVNQIVLIENDGTVILQSYNNPVAEVKYFDKKVYLSESLKTASKTTLRATVKFLSDYLYNEPEVYGTKTIYFYDILKAFETGELNGWAVFNMEEKYDNIN